MCICALGEILNGIHDFACVNGCSMVTRCQMWEIFLSLLLWVVVIIQFYDWIEVSCCYGYEADSWTDKIINRQNHVFVTVHNLMTQKKNCSAGERSCGPMYGQWLKCHCHKLFSKVIVPSFLLPDYGPIEMLH